MSGRVRFDPTFMGRLGRMVGRLRALSARREGSGSSRLAGSGEEFVGHRPWRPGEDTRNLDWNLFARFDQPFVRVFEREAAEHWMVLLDTSASMDVGGDVEAQLGVRQPRQKRRVPSDGSKLQLAAELTMGLASLAAEAGATLTLATSDGARFQLTRARDLDSLRRFLEGLGRPGPGFEGGLGERFARARSRDRIGRIGRVVVIGDLFGLEPRHVLELSGPGRELVVLRVLAAEELLPSQVLFARGGERFELVELETDERLVVGREDAQAYERELEEELETWQSLLAKHRILWRLAEAGLPLDSGRQMGTAFEDVLAPFLRSGGV